jgi:hypothetical protein
MLERVVEVMRGRHADRDRARAHLRDKSSASYASEETSATGNQGAPGIPLGTTRTSSGANVPVEAPVDECGHWLVQGATGSGKSRLVSHVRIQRLARRHGTGVIDCKGELYEADRRWLGVIAATLPVDEQREFVRSLAVLNPFGSDALPPVNPCLLPTGTTELDVHAYETATRFAGLIEGGLSFQGENAMRHLIMLLGEHRLSLLEAPLVLKDEFVRGMLAHGSKHEAVREYFLRTYPELPAVSKEALITRVESLTLSENMRLMLGADAVIDFKTILDYGLPLSMHLGKGPSVPEEQAEVLGSLFFGLIMQAVYAAGPRRRSYQLLVDEFANLLGHPALSRRFRTALTTFRSYKVHLGLVMHNFAQTDAALRETLLTNADCIALFRTSSRNADFFGDFIDTRDTAMLGDPWASFASSRTRRALVMERLQRLPTRYAWWYDRRKAHRAVLLRVADVPEPHQALGWTETQLDDFIREHGVDRGGFALPRSVLRAQIEERTRRLRELLHPPIRVMPARTQEHVSADSRNVRKRRPALG